MKFVVFFALIAFCNAAPAPEPSPNPSLLHSSSPEVITAPIISYSHYFKAPLYPQYTPYFYNLGYASGYSYNAYPYYVPLHLV